MFPQQGQSQQQHMAAQQPSMMQQVLQRVNNEMAAEQERSAFLQFGQFLTGAAQPAAQPFGQHRQPPPQNKAKCFYCNEHNAGHIARNCPKKAKDEEAAAQKRVDEILREREREQAVVVKQEPGALMPSGCMRPFATPVSAEQHFGNNMNFGNNTSMQLTPYSTPQPGQQQMQLQQQTAAQAAAQQQEQMAQAQHDIVAKVQQSVQVSMDAMNATLQQSISDSFSTVRTELENGKASQMLMRSELNSLVTKYEGVVGAVSEVKKSNAALKAAVDATVQSALKRVAVLEAQPPQKRGRDNAGRVTIDIAGTPATPKGRKGPKKKAEPETDPENELIADLANRIVADGVAGALPQRLRKSPPRAAKTKKGKKDDDKGDDSD